MSRYAAEKLEQPTIAEAVSIAAIQDILAIYRPEHRYVFDASLGEPALLTCSLKATKYPYTTHELFEYITSPTANLFACQMAYVLVGALSLHQHPTVSSIRSWQHFLMLRDRTLLRFGEFTIRFRHEVRNAAPIRASISMDWARRFRNCTHCAMQFHIGDGIAGTIRAVLVG